MGLGKYEASGPVAAINVTPLVDVMLVLLVIFMVTAPMLQSGVEVNLPKAATGPLSGSTEQIVLSLTKDGGIFLGSANPVRLEELAVKARAIMDLRPEDQRKIYIKADQEFDYGRIMEVMGQLHAGGITQIGLVSDAAAGTAAKGGTRAGA